MDKKLIERLQSVANGHLGIYNDAAKEELLRLLAQSTVDLIKRVDFLEKVAEGKYVRWCGEWVPDNCEEEDE